MFFFFFFFFFFFEQLCYSEKKKKESLIEINTIILVFRINLTFLLILLNEKKKHNGLVNFSKSCICYRESTILLKHFFLKKERVRLCLAILHISTKHFSMKLYFAFIMINCLCFLFFRFTQCGCN